jgi:hypothetical protein
MSTPIRIKRSAVPGKVPTTTDLQLGELAINTYDGKAYLKKDVSGTESIVNVGGGYPGKTYYVSETGLDTNDGENISSAFLTIKKALSVSTIGDTIEISSGTFTEIFPLTVPAGVIVRGKGLRSTIIQPTAGTERLDCFLLNGETTVEELTVTNFYYNSSTDTGYAFRFAPGMVTTTRSPYVQRVTVLTRGSVTTASDPYGFDTPDNYPTTKVAGRGALIDGSVVSSATLEPAILFNEATFITPNQTGLKMTNGARAEWVNCFTYFSSVSIDGSSGSVGVGSTAGATLKLAGVTTSISPNYVIKYYQGGPAVAIGTVTSVDGAYVTISGKGSGIFNAVGIGSTQDVRIFQSNGTTQVGTASTILWADYQKFGADLRAIGAAANFGTIGVRGDGAGVQLRLFGYNFGCVGSGKTFTQDPTLTVRSNEAVQLNGGRVFFQSVDQLGNFRVGNIFEISQETGAVSLASTSDINIAGTATIQNLNVIGVSTFGSTILHTNSNYTTNQTTYNLINSAAGAVNFAGAGTSIVIGATTGITTIRNYRVNLSGGQDSFTTTDGTLVVAGGVGISSNLNVGKDFRVTGVSTFVSPVRLDSSLRVAGVSTFVQSIDANSTLNVTGVSTLTGNVRLGGQLNVTGISTLVGDSMLSSNLRVAGVSTFVQSIDANSTLNVTGVSTLTGNVRLGGQLRVAGISTFVDDVELSDHLRVAGVSTFNNPAMINSNLNVTGITTTATFRVTGISTLTGNVELSNALRVAGVSTFSNPAMINSNLNVTGITTTGNFRVTGVSTLTGDTNLTNNLNVGGITTTATFRVTGISTLTGNVEMTNALRVSGVSTFVGDSMFSANMRVAGVSTFVSSAMINSNLNVTGITTTGNFRVTGVSTLTGDTNLTNNLNVGGITTTASLRVTGLSTLSGNVELSNALRVAGVSTFSNPAMINSNLNVTGITTTATFRVTGVSTLTGDTQFSNNIRVAGVGTIANFTISSGIITGPSEIIVDPAGVGDKTGSVRIKGDLFVEGTQTTVNSTVVEIGDKLVGLGTTAIEIVVLKTNVNISAGQSIITGISTSFLSVGYGVSSNSSTGAGSSIVSIGSSSVGIGTSVAGNTDVTIPNIVIGIATTRVSVASTLGIIVGAAVSAAAFAANTVVTSIGLGTIFFSPASINVGVSTLNVTFTNNGVFYFTDLLTGDVVSDGGGILLYGKTNKTFTWVDSTDSWTSSEHLDLVTGKVLKFNGIEILTATNLGISNVNALSGVVTTIEGTTATYTNTNATTVTTVNLTASGTGTISTFTATNVNVTGIATLSTLNATDAAITLAGIATANINVGIVTTGTIETLNVPTQATFKVINNANISGITSINSGIVTDLIVGVSSVTTLRANSGIITGLTVENSNTTGVATVNYFVASNSTITGIATINAGIITTLTASRAELTQSNVGILTANVGFITQFSALSGIITSLYTTGVGTISTLYVNSGITTRSTITDLDVTGVGTFGVIANVNTPTGLSTIGHLTGTNISYSGIGTIQTLNVGVATITTLNVTGISSLPNLYGSDIQYTGISTLTELRGTNLYYSGLSTAVNFRSTDTIVSGVASITTLRADVGIITNSVWTDGYSAGITSVATFRANSGIITTLTVANSTQGYLIGTDIYYSGIGSISTFRTNVGFATFLSGTNLSYTGVSTVVSFNATDVNVSGTTTISTLLISPNNQLTHLSNGTNLAFSGIGTINTLRSNVGFVTTLSGTNLNYSGVGTVGFVNATNINSSGVTTTVNFRATNINASGITTTLTLLVNQVTSNATFSRYTSTAAIVSGVSSITTLRANVGIITNSTATNLNVTGIGTIVTLVATNLQVTGVGTIVTLNGTNSNFTGVSTFNELRATSIITDALDLSGTAINFTGIATFNTLFSTNGTIEFLRGTSTNFTGINTLSTIYNVDINSTGFTTTRGLHVGVGGSILTATNISGIGSVGINTTSAKRALQVYGELQINGNTIVGTISTTRNNNSAVKVHTSLGRDEFRTVEYTVQASIGNTHQVTKILSIHDGVTAYNSEYSNISTGVDVATYDVQIDNTVPPGFIALVVTPVSNVGVTTIVVNYTATRI